MKRVLIVDDERHFLLSLTEGLAAYAGHFNVVSATNGREAMDVLSSTKVDLVVTDLKMPVMDGFELLAHMSRSFPTIPAIVITAFGSPEIEEKLQALGQTRFLEKPLAFDILAETILEELAAGSKGHIQGITLPTFLQMVELERKTYTLKVKSQGRIGYLYFLDGVLMQAETRTLEGEEAAREIVSWAGASIEIRYKCRIKKKHIESPLPFILMEAYRIKDETTTDGGERGLELDLFECLDVMRSESQSEGSIAAEPANQKEVNVMAAQDTLKEFATLSGFLGVGVFTPGGESLATYGNEKVNLKEVGALANNVLMNAQKASLEMGTGRGELVHVECEKACIIVRCLNEGTDPIKSQPGKAHIHLVLMLSSDESIGLAKMRVGSLIRNLAEDFRI